MDDDTFLLLIRPEQLEALGRAAGDTFRARAVDALRNAWPELAAQAEEDVRDFVLRGIERAARYGITSQRDLLRFLNLSLRLGEDFDERDPAAREILALRDFPAAVRIDRLVRDVLARDGDV